MKEELENTDSIDMYLGKFDLMVTVSDIDFNDDEGCISFVVTWDDDALVGKECTSDDIEKEVGVIITKALEESVKLEKGE